MVPFNVKTTEAARDLLRDIEAQLYALGASEGLPDFPDSKYLKGFRKLMDELRKPPELTIGESDEAVQSAWAKEYRMDVVSTLYPNLTGGEVILDKDEYTCEVGTIDALPVSWRIEHEEDDFRCEIKLSLWTVRGGLAIYKAELGDVEVFRHVDQMAEYGLRIADFVS